MLDTCSYTSFALEQRYKKQRLSGCLYRIFLLQLTKNYGVDYEITALLDKMDFIILPVANPDGYAYSWYMGGKNDVSFLSIVL